MPKRYADEDDESVVPPSTPRVNAREISSRSGAMAKGSTASCGSQEKNGAIGNVIHWSQTWTKEKEMHQSPTDRPRHVSSSSAEATGQGEGFIAEKQRVVSGDDAAPGAVAARSPASDTFPKISIDGPQEQPVSLPPIHYGDTAWWIPFKRLFPRKTKSRATVRQDRPLNLNSRTREISSGAYNQSGDHNIRENHESSTMASVSHSGLTRHQEEISVNLSTPEQAGQNESRVLSYHGERAVASSTQQDEEAFDAVLASENREDYLRGIMDGAVEAVDVRAEVQNERGRRKWVPVVATLFLLVVAGLGAALGVVLGQKNNKGNGEEVEITPYPTTTIPSQSPTLAPTGSPTSVEFSQVAALVESLFGQETLRDASSPQYRAADWMAHIDVELGDISTVDPERFRQRYSVVVFYFATGGEGWTNQYSFLTPDADECSWNEPAPQESISVYKRNGVSVCTSQGEVGGLEFEMGGNNMTGTLPDELGSLSKLVSLLLPTNNIIGSLPLTLFDLQDLKYLHLALNDISGTIPSEIGKLTNLAFINFQQSSLSGTIPSEVGNLSNMIVFSITNSFLSGTAPTTMLQMGKLLLFDVGGNQLSGEFFLDFPAFWPDLAFVSVRNNRLSGKLPDNIGSLSNLQSISFHENNFTGPIPESITKLQLLEQLSLGDNNFTGSLPDDWSPVSESLQMFVVGGNKLSGTLPASLGGMRILRFFSVNRNSFSGTVPEEFSSLPQGIRWFMLNDNGLSGAVPQFLAKFTSLEILDLRANGLAGDLSYICNQSTNGVVFPNVKTLAVDCLGDSPQVVCPCCFICCNEMLECVDQ